jgi:hypothetical protein
MLKRLIAALFLLLAAFCSRAADYTDVYYTATEAGWGFFLVQSDTFQFIAFFIYGPDNKPTWYVATLSDNGMGSYTGNVYLETGTYFALPWNPAQQIETAAGTASFTPIDAYHATFSYTINGVGTVTKNVQRQTLTPYVLSGSYSGALVGSISGCANPAQNVSVFTYRFNLTVTQVDDSSATLSFTVVDGPAPNLVCTFSGAINHIGRLYQMPNASYSCPLSLATAAIINQFHVTGQGIEGRWHANDGGNCTESGHFSAVDLSLR